MSSKYLIEAADDKRVKDLNEQYAYLEMRLYPHHGNWYSVEPIKKVKPKEQKKRRPVDK